MTHPYSIKQNEHWLHGMHARPSSAVIILEDDQRKALIVKANYKTHWTFPGGMIDAGETPKQAAIREISEEVGLTIDADNVQFGWMAARHSEIADTYQFIFKARLQDGQANEIILQASEIDEWRLVSKDEVLSNNLHYAKTVELWARDNVEGYIEQTFGFGV
ncbi:MAG TPA: NUDIX hydrolase [Candidatus Saccharimonadales bacterium]|jgi:8-oxo-dGTP pyrophosphatase MutT (NUDIX family)|nr:NUDIX hydrolase [Candidatus Saccharimonadales bacterium]